ncbi:MAG: histidine--tRNA ligase [Thermoanaerobaculia bacterium]
MTKKYQSVKGTRDLLPPETAVWAAVEETAREVFHRFGYGEIRTPVFEETELFVRSVGECTDVVGKQMYSFTDRKGRGLTLRPESTAAVARAYVQHGLAELPAPLRLYYIGPHFRYERPQKGRYRQFSQVGAELIGEDSPLADVELLVMLVRFLESLGFADLTVLLNSVGDGASRAAYRTVLVEYLQPHGERLSEDSRRRLETNPLRILDSKVEADRQILSGSPRIEDSLTAASRAHLQAVREGLEAVGVRYRMEPGLVRGLDYYTETVFEIVAEGLGAQDAIVGGGRYDQLIKEIGGSPTPAIGFALGLDRLIEVLPGDSPQRRGTAPPAVVVAVGEVAPLEALRLADELRRAGCSAVAELGGRSLKSALKRADRAAAASVVLLGDEELAVGEATVRFLGSGEQRRVRRDDLAVLLREEATA